MMALARRRRWRDSIFAHHTTRTSCAPPRRRDAMADTSEDHTDELMEGAGTRIQGQQWAMEQPVTVLESRAVIGAEVHGVDLSQPLSPAAFATIETALHIRAVLCVRQQRLTAPQFIDFARRFGAVERIFLTHYAHPQHPEIMLVSNIQENGRL